MWEISLVITPPYLNTFGRVYWFLSKKRIHRSPHLAHVVFWLVISSSQSSVILYALTIYQYIQYSISAYYKLVITTFYLRNQYVMFRLLYLFLCFLNYISLQLYSILHAQSIQLLTHTCATFSRYVGLGFLYPDHA